MMNFKIQFSATKARSSFSKTDICLPKRVLFFLKSNQRSRAFSIKTIFLPQNPVFVDKRCVFLLKPIFADQNLFFCSRAEKHFHKIDLNQPNWISSTNTCFFLPNKFFLRQTCLFWKPVFTKIVKNIFITVDKQFSSAKIYLAFALRRFFIQLWGTTRV